MKLDEIQRVLKVCGKTDWRGWFWSAFTLASGWRLRSPDLAAGGFGEQHDFVCYTENWQSAFLGLGRTVGDYLNELPSVDDPRASISPAS